MPAHRHLQEPRAHHGSRLSGRIDPGRVSPFLPLWGESQEELLEEWARQGFEGVVAAVRTDALGLDWLGRRLGRGSVEELKLALLAGGLSPGGEAGEYHTLAVRGPPFGQLIQMEEAVPVLVREDSRRPTSSDMEVRNLNELLTVPAPVEPAPYLPVGNHVLAVPGLRVQDAAIDSLNVLLRRQRGLVGLDAPPAPGGGPAAGGFRQALLRPWVEVEGRRFPLELGWADWERLEGWVPRFSVEREGWRLEGTVVCPPQERGLVYLLRLTRPTGGGGPAPSPVSLGLEGTWGRVSYAALRPRPVEATLHPSRDPWTGALVLEVRSGLPLFALGLAVPDAEVGRWDERGWSVRRSYELLPGETAELAAFLAVAPEGDGAAVTTVHLRRRGAAALLHESLAWLSRRRLRFDSPDLAAAVAQNQFFNCFFAVGEALDAGTLQPLTSRSPRYYVCGAFWARDAFLWTLPALILTDRELARRVLLGALELYLCHPGEHALYPDGRLLYPGFELDQACAALVALDLYLHATLDMGIYREPQVYYGRHIMENALSQRRHPRVALYSTFLDPCDDPVRNPYLTYDNALAWRALRVLGDIDEGLGDDGRAAYWRKEAEAVRKAIRRHCVVKGPLGDMFAWSVDPDRPGSEELYDAPAGSLELLSYLGVCDQDDPVYRNTVAWIYSAHNPFFPGSDGGPVEAGASRAGGGTGAGAPAGAAPAGAGTDAGAAAPAFRGPGCRHAPATWPLSAANCLLGRSDRARAQQALRFFAEAEMDGGLFCETVDPATGRVRTGAAFASGAGFMATAVWAWFQEERLEAEDRLREAAASRRRAAGLRRSRGGRGRQPASGKQRPRARGKGRGAAGPAPGRSGA
ncbi:MAG: glycoside hydrolase family 125 protein [Acetobacteraceae bacterium]|nr:glycoside hydrolase family 125 protein [Acetobacteraceae bacterium]